MTVLSFKKTLPAVIAVALLPFVVSCSSSDDDDKGLIIDYAPVNLYFEIVDAAGNDRLLPDADGYYGGDFTFQYNGEVHACSWEAPSYPEGRYLLPTFRGLYFDFWNYNQKGTGQLVFGELDGARNYDVDMELVEPDGTRHKIHYYRKVKQLDVKETLTFDGKKIENYRNGKAIRIVK